MCLRLWVSDMTLRFKYFSFFSPTRSDPSSLCSSVVAFPLRNWLCVWIACALTYSAIVPRLSIVVLYLGLGSVGKDFVLWCCIALSWGNFFWLGTSAFIGNLCSRSVLALLRATSYLRSIAFSMFCSVVDSGTIMVNRLKDFEFLSAGPDLGAINTGV